MRILLLTQIVPSPPDSGPKIKTRNVLKHLAQQGHEVHLVSFCRSETETQAAEALRPWCASITLVPIVRSRLRDVLSLARSFMMRRPFLVERDDLPAMRAAIQTLLGQHRFDAVHADQLTMGQFAVNLPLPLRVLDEHNAVWTIIRRIAQHEAWGPRRLVAELEWRRLRAYELALCQQFDRTLVVSDTDLHDLTPPDSAPPRASVIPISVDTDALACQLPGPEARHILSMATMFYPPNVEGVLWFGREILPLIRAQAPETRFLVVGARPPAEVHALAADDTSGVEVTGYVPDLDAYIKQSAVLVVPLHSGSGMRVKILEAFARGIPVVSTTIGVEGIDARHGEHLLVADSPATFGAAVLDVLRDREGAARRAQAARALVEERYAQSSALRDLDSLYPPPTTDTPAQVVAQMSGTAGASRG